MEKEIMLIIAVGLVAFTLGFSVGNEVGWWRCFNSWKEDHKKTLEEQHSKE